MKKRGFMRTFFSFLMSAELICGGVPLVQGAETVTISSAEELLQYAQRVNSGECEDAVLAGDLDLGELESAWMPVGNQEHPFTASFDGQGYTIYGLNLTDEAASASGLFGYLASSAVIRDVAVEGASAGQKAGGLAGISYGTIQNCTSNVYVQAQSYAGGIAAESHGTIQGCINYGEISAKLDCAGGIVGSTDSPVSGCDNYGFVSGRSKVGGIAGFAVGMSENANYGTITSVGEFCGGVAGVIKGTKAAPEISIDHCSNQGEIQGAKSVGGIFGSIYYGIVEADLCLNAGKVTGSGQWVGGIVGSIADWDYAGEYTLRRCENRAPVHSVGNYAGGIVGHMLVGNIVDSCNSARVTSVLTPGGIVGFANASTTTIQNTINTSPNTLCFGNAKCENVYALNASAQDQKKTAEQFRDGTVLALVNGNNVWEQGEEYPILLEMPQFSGVRTAEELKQALNDPAQSTIFLAQSFSIDEPIPVNHSVTINGNGFTLSGAGTIFAVQSAKLTLQWIALGGDGVLMTAESGEVCIDEPVRMYNRMDLALRMEDSVLSFAEHATLYTMPGTAISANTKQTFPIRFTETVTDNRFLYTLNHAKTGYSRVSNIVLKAENNEGLSKDVYGFIKSGTLYLMVPACVELSHCVYTEIDQNGAEYQTVTADFTGESTYQVNIGSIDYPITAMQSKLPTLYLDIHEEFGTIDAMNSSEDHSVCSYGDLTIDVPQELADRYGWKTKYESVEGDAKKPATVEVRGRGNSTWSTSPFRKKPYQVKAEKKIDLMGMGKAKTWCLIKDGNYFVGQKLGLDLGLAMGLSCTPDSRFVEVYMNGEYLGCYTLTEKVQVNKERVNITDLEDLVDSNGITPDTDLTGGYLMEIDNYSGDPIVLRTNGNSITVKSPENLDKEATMNNNYSYIYHYMDDLFTAIYGDGKMPDGSSYLEHIDIESFVRYYWHQELIENMDCGIGSTYLYKDADSINPKLFAGPVWDNDNIFKSEDDLEKWYAKNLVQYNGANTLYHQLMSRKDFVSYAIWYYKNSDIREKLASSVELVESYREQLGAADQMDFIKWGVNTFENGTRLLSYLNRRLAWIDENYMSLLDEAELGEAIDVDKIMEDDPSAPLAYAVTSVKLLDSFGKEIQSIEGHKKFGVRIDVQKKTEEEKAAELVAAVYDENGRMCSLKRIELRTEYPYSASFSFQFSEEQKKPARLKVLLWNRMENLNPLCPFREIALQ